MFMSEYPVDEIIAVHRLVWKELVLLSPALIFLYQDDPGTALRRLYRLRSKELVEKDIRATSQYPWFQSRGLNGIDGWIQFFAAWQVVAGKLYDDWPFLKIKISNPHDDWTITHQQMHHFLQVPQSP